ncbi:MAG: hypothetical protein LUE99_18145 [Bacteroides sp.]|nr:hypothetical protein [Bacteroides sp.]
MNSPATIDALNAEIDTWNAANADYICPFKYEASTDDNLPHLVEVVQ